MCLSVNTALFCLHGISVQGGQQCIVVQGDSFDRQADNAATAVQHFGL